MIDDPDYYDYNIELEDEIVDTRGGYSYRTTYYCFNVCGDEAIITFDYGSGEYAQMNSGYERLYGKDFDVIYNQYKKEINEFRKENIRY